MPDTDNPSAMYQTLNKCKIKLTWNINTQNILKYVK